MRVYVMLVRSFIFAFLIVFSMSCLAVTKYNFTFTNKTNDDIEIFRLTLVGQEPISDLLNCEPTNSINIGKNQTVTFKCSLIDPQKTGGGPMSPVFQLVHSEQIPQQCYFIIPGVKPDSENNFQWNIVPWKNGFMHCCTGDNVCDR